MEHLAHAKALVAKFEEKNKTKQVIEEKIQEYQVEKILMKRELHKHVSWEFQDWNLFDKFSFQVYYFVKWFGYPSVQSSWEPAEHLLNSPKIVKEFEKSLQQRKEMQKGKKNSEKIEVELIIISSFSKNKVVWATIAW